MSTKKFNRLWRWLSHYFGFTFGKCTTEWTIGKKDGKKNKKPMDEQKQ